MTPRKWRCPVWLTGAGLVMVASLYMFFLAPPFRCAHGLLLVAPWLLVCLLPDPAEKAASRKEHGLAILAGVYVGGYVALSFLVERPHGASEWGPRFLLLAYPLCAIVGAVRVKRMLALGQRGMNRTLAILLSLGLALVGCQHTIRGIREMQMSKYALDAIRKEIRLYDGPILTDQPWVAGGIGPDFLQREIYTLRMLADFPVWLEQIGSKTNRFAYVSKGPLPIGEAEAQAAGLSCETRILLNRVTFLRCRIDAFSPLK